MSLALAAEPGAAPEGGAASAGRHEVVWWDQPTPVSLQPVTPQYVQRHRELMDRASTGRGASPLYRDAWARMDAHTALLSWGVDGVPISEDEAARYRDLAFAAATLGGQDLLNETIDRSPTLSMARSFGRTLVAPSFEIESGRGGPKVQLAESESARRNAQAAVALQDAPMVRPQGPPPPSLRMGSGWALRPLDAEDPSSSFDVAWSAWVLSRNLAADSLRLSVDVVSLPIDDPADSELTLSWSLAAREQLVDGWYLLAEARSLPGSYDPRHLRSGLAWQFLPEDPRWNVRSTYTYGFERETSAGDLRMAEHRVDLRVQWAGPWVAPSSPHRWPLGDQVDNGPGPSWPRTSEGVAMRPPISREADGDDKYAMSER